MKLFLIFLFCISGSTKAYLQVVPAQDTNLERYTGEYKDGKKNGHGKMTYENGAVYEGYWKDDMKNGKGKIVDIDGTSYEGEWKNDLMLGIATILSPDGSRYVGEVSNNGIKNGKGTLTLKDGSSFIGEFSNGKYYKGVLIDKKQEGVWYTYSGEFNDNQIYNGTKTTEFKNCPTCADLIADYSNGVMVKERADTNVDNSDLRKPKTKVKLYDGKRVTWGLAISGGFNFARLTGGDSDIIDSTSVGYSPSLLMNIKLTKSTSIEFSIFYIKKEFEFFNFGNNLEYNFSSPLYYSTDRAIMRFYEYGVSVKFNYRFLFIGGYYSKLISAIRSGNIYCTDPSGNVFLDGSNYKYNFMKEQDYPKISGHRAMNEYVYGISFGIEGRGDHFLLGVGYDLNLSNYINNKYPLWDESYNIDFYDTKEFNIRLSYLYLKMGYIF